MCIRVNPAQFYEYPVFFCWTLRPKETLRIDKRVNLIVGRCATATLLITRIRPHPTEQHHKWQREPHGVCQPGGTLFLFVRMFAHPTLARRPPRTRVGRNCHPPARGGGVD